MRRHALKKPLRFIGPYVIPYESGRCIPKVRDIQLAVAAHYALPRRVMLDACRRREYARPRQVAMYLARTLTPRSLPEIGRWFGGRDHTTVLHAVRAIETLRQFNPELDADIRALAGRLAA